MNYKDKRKLISLGEEFIKNVCKLEPHEHIAILPHYDEKTKRYNLLFRILFPLESKRHVHFTISERSIRKIKRRLKKTKIYIVN